MISDLSRHSWENKASNGHKPTRPGARWSNGMSTSRHPVIAALPTCLAPSVQKSGEAAERYV